MTEHPNWFKRLVRSIWRDRAWFVVAYAASYAIGLGQHFLHAEDGPWPWILRLGGMWIAAEIGNKWWHRRIDRKREARRG
jgi:hypothetical protein